MIFLKKYLSSLRFRVRNKTKEVIFSFNKIALLRLRSVLALLAMMLLISCAQQVPLTGGEKDIEAPKELESFPKNGSANFNSDEIVIEFDEFIQIQNLSSQLIVSPLMESEPEVMVKNKKLVIKLKDTLSANTTYSLNFGNAIMDITENNPFPNYKYVFSTGGFVDSLSFSGTIINAQDLTPQEQTYVLLYNQFEDSVPLKEKPRYIAISDKEGNFNITNIASGTYKLFAINDINGNYLFDLPNEEIAFSNELITINESSANNILYLFEEESNIQYVVKSEHKKYGKIDVILNTPPTKLAITAVNNTPKEFAIKENNKTNDSLTLWILPTVNTKEIEFELKDDTAVIDTLNFSLINAKKFNDSALVVQSNIGGQFDLNQNIFLTLNRPFVAYYSDSLKLIEDSIEVKPNYPLVDIGLRKFELAYDFKENANYQLIIPPNTFEDLYGIKNDTTIINFKTKKTTDYGAIALNIAPNFTDNYILQLRKNKKIIQQDFLTGKQLVNYKYLVPGNYELKLIIDTNNDKKWTTGKYIDQQQPEKILFYEKEISIRANWDNDISWIIKE